MSRPYPLPHTAPALAALATAALGAPVEPVSVVESGFDHRVLLARRAGQAWVFRFPRRPQVLDDLVRERRILALLHRRPPGPALPAWQVDTVVHGLPVIGYPVVPGQPAGEEPGSDGEFVLSIRDPLPEHFIRPLGAALARVHGLPRAEVADALGEPAPDARALAAERVDQVTGANLISPARLEWLRAALDEPRWWDIRVTLVHGDVHPGHTLIDPDGRLTGLLDWTDSGWGDPAIDFVPTVQVYGRTALLRLVDAYRAAGGQDDGDLADRVTVLSSFAVVKAIADALDADRHDLLPRLTAVLNEGP